MSRFKGLCRFMARHFYRLALMAEALFIVFVYPVFAYVVFTTGHHLTNFWVITVCIGAQIAVFQHYARKGEWHKVW